MTPAKRRTVLDWILSLFAPEWPQTPRPSSPPALPQAPVTVVKAPPPPGTGLPLNGAAGSSFATGSRPLPLFPDENACTVLGTDVNSGQEVTISLKELLLALYGIGAMGTGKTTLDLNMIIDFIKQGLGLCVIEPHSSLVRSIIAAMPGDRLNDVIYLDLSDSTSSFGLNFFETPPGADDTD